MSWQFSICLFFIFSVWNTLWSRAYAQKSKLPGKVPPALIYTLGLLPFGVIYALIGRNIHITWSVSTIIYLLLEGIFIGLFNWLAFIAFKRTKVAQFETIFQLYVLTAAVLGWIILHESLNGRQLLGSGLLIIGALIAANAKKDANATKRAHAAIGIVLTVLAALSLGVGLVAEKAALGRMTLSAYFIFGFGMQALAAIIIGLRAGLATKLSAYTRYEILSCLGIGLLSAVGGYFYIYSLVKTNNIALVTAVTTFQLPLVVIGGYFILKEKDNIARMTLACGVALVGLILCIR